MLELAKLIDMIVGFATPIVQSKLQRSELVIKLLKQLNLDPDHPPADFTAVYQYTLVEYGIGKLKAVLEMFRQAEIQAIFRKALDQNNPSLLLKEGETFLSGNLLGDQIRELGIDARQEFYQFAAVFIEVAKRTRTPAEVLANHQLESLHRQIGNIQERLHRLPTLEAMRTEMARLVAQSYPALPGVSASSASIQERQLHESQCRAFALAQQMKGWFETLGYRFESYEVWQDDYFEWIIDIPVRRGRYDRILVRGIDGEVGLGDIRALRQSVEAQRADEGWLVTARRISRAAREEVEKEENHDLGCYTFDELLDQDADFSGYLDWLESEIQRRGIEQKYVPLACIKEEIDPDTKQRIGVSRYDDLDGWIDGYIDLWLDDPAKEHISVLGEFGTGKTWFAFHYASQALKRYREAQQRGVERPRLPLVIPLRDYAKAVSVESLFSEFFFRKHEVRSLTYSAFEQLNRMGKLLLIFDGFDEMAARVDRQEMINNFWELAKAVVPGAKVILTCRTEHFPEAREGRDVLNAQLQASTTNLTGEMPQFEVLELEKFGDEQIRQVMSLQAEASTVEQVMGNSQLLDLARRPVMTELILEALPDIEAGKPVDMSRVYLYAVRRKMERDIKEERTFTSLAEKLYFLCELSWEMLSSDRMSLNYREFPDRIRRLFGSVVQEEKDLDHWHYDMMGQTMLIRNADGDYSPAHRSLLEFFVAYKFAAELGLLAPDFLELAQKGSNTNPVPAKYQWSEYFQQQDNRQHLKEFIAENLDVLLSSFGHSPLTKALIDLLEPMVISDDSVVQHSLKGIVAKTRNRSIEEVGYIGGNAVTLLVKADRNALKRSDLSNTVICGADLSTASLLDTNFSYATLTGSTFPKIFGSVFTLAYSPDRKILAVAGASCVIDLWHEGEGSPYLTLKGHVEWIRALAFSPDGKTLFSAAFDHTIRSWNLETGEGTYVFSDTNRINSISISLDCRYLASASDDHTIKLWNPYTGDALFTLQGHTASVEALLITEDSRTLISASSDHDIRIWDLETASCSATLEGHTDRVRSLALSSGCGTLASSAFDQTIRLWNLKTHECIRVLKGHNNRKISSVAFSSDDTLLASSSYDETVKIWNVQTGECLRTLAGHRDWVRIVKFSPDDSMVVSGSDDQTIKYWSVETGECIKTLQGYTGQVRAIAISPDGGTLAVGTEDAGIKLWTELDFQDHSRSFDIRAFRGHDSRINSVKISADGKLLATGSFDRSAKIWDLETGICKSVLKGHAGCVNEIAFTSDSRYLATASADSLIKVWSVETGSCISTLEGHADWLWALAIDPTDQILASGGIDRVIRLWKISTSECIASLKGHSGAINSMVFTPNANALISASSDATIKLWNLETGESFLTLTGHTNYILCLAISNEGNKLASCGQDRTVRIWDLQTGTCLKVLEGHSDGIRSIVFTPDGSQVISGSFDQSVKVWDVETGKCLRSIRSPTSLGRMNITGVKGLTDTEISTLKALGAIEN